MILGGEQKQLKKLVVTCLVLVMTLVLATLLQGNAALARSDAQSRVLEYKEYIHEGREF